MNNRQRQQLKILCDSGSFCIDDAAQSYLVSSRTIRYDIEEINRVLVKQCQLPPLEIKHKIVSLPQGLDPKSLRTLIELKEQDQKLYHLSPRERVLRMVFDLCGSNHYVTAQELAERYEVSRTTILRDLENVRDYCGLAGVKLVSSVGKGLKIEASEKARRSCLSQIIRDWNPQAHKHLSCNPVDYAHWFDIEEFVQVQEILLSAEQLWNLYLDDVSFEALVVHIELALRRYWTGQQEAGLKSRFCEKSGKKQTALSQTKGKTSAESSSTELSGIDSRVKKSEDCPQKSCNSVVQNLPQAMAVQIVDSLNLAFGIELPIEEIDYISVHLRAKSSELASIEQPPDARMELACLELIEKVSEQTGQDLRADSHLYQALLQHLAECSYRKRNGLLLANPLKTELMDSHAELYSIVRSCILSGLLNFVEPSLDEIAYIVLHLAAALCRSGQNSARQARILVVCATGYGTADLVQAELERHFSLDIVAACSLHTLLQQQKLDADLIISTVPVDSSFLREQQLSCVQVSPIFRNSDIQRISAELEALGLPSSRFGLHKRSVLARRLLGICEQYSAPGDEQQLISQLSLYIKQQSQTEQGRVYMLSELLDQSKIRLDVEAADWRDAVCRAGRVLEESGCIDQSYVEAVIQNIEEMGPYVVITKGVALPHATNNVGVYQTAMSLLRLKRAVNFGNPDNDPVELVFMLATTDAHSHLEALRCLANLLGDPESRNYLKQVQSADELAQYIAKFEEQTLVNV